jgi:hypothetical protein
MQVALGFCTHTAWAVGLGVAAGPDGSWPPKVLARSRFELSDQTVPDQPYHAAAELPLARASAMITRSEQVWAGNARAGVAELAAQLRAGGHDVVAAGVPVSSASVPPDLATVLSSHPLLHAAEGRLVADAITEAADEEGLRVTVLSARDLRAEAAQACGRSLDALHVALTELGRAVGRPWRREEKDAVLAGWLALHRP